MFVSCRTDSERVGAAVVSASEEPPSFIQACMRVRRTAYIHVEVDVPGGCHGAPAGVKVVYSTGPGPLPDLL